MVRRKRGATREGCEEKRKGNRGGAHERYGCVGRCGRRRVDSRDNAPILTWQGCEYTSRSFGQRCREMGVRPSMGSVGDAYASG